MTPHVPQVWRHGGSGLHRLAFLQSTNLLSVDHQVGGLMKEDIA